MKEQSHCQPLPTKLNWSSGILTVAHYLRSLQLTRIYSYRSTTYIYIHLHTINVDGLALCGHWEIMKHTLLRRQGACVAYAVLAPNIDGVAVSRPAHPQRISVWSPTVAFLEGYDSEVSQGDPRTQRCILRILFVCGTWKSYCNIMKLYTVYCTEVAASRRAGEKSTTIDYNSEHELSCKNWCKRICQANAVSEVNRKHWVGQHLKLGWKTMALVQLCPSKSISCYVIKLHLFTKEPYSQS